MKKTVDRVTLGKRVKEYRIDSGYSREQLSEMTGYSKSHISNIERADSNASADALVQIANALNVSVDMLLCESLNGKAAQEARMYEFAKMLDDCSSSEIKVIIETLKTLKKNLREYDADTTEK